MTVNEVILSFPVIEGANANLIEKFATDRGLLLSSNYTVGLKKETDLVVADLYNELAQSPDYSENRFSEKYPREYLKARAAELYKYHNETPPSEVFNIRQAW